MDDKPWFLPKAVGYGVGAPASWQGWLLLIGLLVSVLLGIYLARTCLAGDIRQFATIIAVAVPLAVFVPIARKKTEGGWRDGSHL